MTEKTDATPVDSGLSAVALALNLLQIPVEQDALKRSVGASSAFTVSDILMAIQACGASASHLKPNLKRLHKMPAPLIVPLKAGGFAVVTAVNDEGIYLQNSNQVKPEVLSIAEFSGRWRGEAIVIKPRGALQRMRFGLSWFWPALTRYRLASGNVLLASLLLQIFALITPLFTMIIIDKVLGTSGYRTLDVLLLALLAIAVFDVIMNILRSQLLGNLTNRIDAELMADLFAHLVRLPMSFFSTHRTGDLASRVKELEMVRNFFTGPAVTAVIDFPFVGVFILVMYWFSPPLTALVVAAVIALLLLYAVAGAILRRRIREKSRASADNQSFLVEGIASIETVKSLSLEPQIQRQWEDQVVESADTAHRSEQLNQHLGQIAGFINKLTVALALWLGARIVLQGEMTPGQLIGFNMMVGRVLGPAMRIAQLFQHIQQAQVSVQRIKQIFHTQPEYTHASPARGMPDIEGRVAFDRVAFSYGDGQQNVLEDLSFEVNPGEVIGIAGVSGAGKTTLIRLLQRLYLPRQGRILVDGIDIAEVDPVWLRRQIGVVAQDGVLLNRSVRDNIAFANPGMHLKEVEFIAELAGADRFIRALPEAYNTMIGERGAVLSMGQRQRIALARALAADPKLLILDEATSALDSEAERQIQRNMKRITQGRTVFIISHRLSTLRIADRIITLEHGRIQDFDHFDQLVHSNSRFAELYAAQTHAVKDENMGQPKVWGQEDVEAV